MAKNATPKVEIDREEYEKLKRDSVRLRDLQNILQHCGGAVVGYNDDPDHDIEGVDHEGGAAPVGFYIATDGCNGDRIDVGQTLGEAIDKAAQPGPNDD